MWRNREHRRFLRRAGSRRKGLLRYNSQNNCNIEMDLALEIVWKWPGTAATVVSARLCHARSVTRNAHNGIIFDCAAFDATPSFAHSHHP